MVADKLIINVALTGNVPTKADNPALPVTADEIARDARACRALGASIVHVHARDTDGEPTFEIDAFAEVVAAVRRAAPDVIVCVTTSGRRFREFEQRAAVLGLEGGLRPEMASLTLGSMNFPKEASVNAPQTIVALAQRMRAQGVLPELEVFDLGMIDYAKYLIRKDVLRPPFYANVILGSLGTLAATPLNLALTVQALPPEATWAGGGVGRYQFQVNDLAVAMGGHVRVGLEDNLFMDDDKTVPATNAALVERTARVAEAMGRAIATPDEARAIVGLRSREPLPVQTINGPS